MYENLWQKAHSSVCSITALRGSERVASGTGFKVGDRLVTNYHVIHVPAATHFQFRFVTDDSFTDSVFKLVTRGELEAGLSDSMPTETWDYAIVGLDWPDFESVPSLRLCVEDKFRIGQSVAIFGYQFDQPNLSIHRGILASRIVINGVRLLQLDASVNQGNSGGPLMDPSSLEVIGIVTRKSTGLSTEFDQLMQSFEHNIQALEGASQGGVRLRLSGIDPIEAMKISQKQMAKVSLEIKRSANVGIGFAYELEKIRQGLRK